MSKVVYRRKHEYETILKNPGKYAKNPISPEDSRSQNTRRSGAGPRPHHLAAPGGGLAAPDTPRSPSSPISCLLT